MTNPTRSTAATPGSGERTSTYPLEQLFLLWRRGERSAELTPKPNRDADGRPLVATRHEP